MNYFSINHSDTFLNEAKEYSLAVNEINSIDNVVTAFPLIGRQLGTPFPKSDGNSVIGLYEYEFQTIESKQKYFLYYFFLGQEVTYIGVKSVKLSISESLLMKLLDACAAAHVETQLHEG